MTQDILREKTKIAKATNDDIFYKDFAEYLDMNINSFYNWLNGAYDLSETKARKLEDIVIDLL